MRHITSPAAVRVAVLPTIAALLLAGCGGGGGGSSASDPAPSAATPPTPPPSGSSTALKDNTASTGANFSNFASGTVSVPVAGVAFVGSRRFVKVARPDGAVLFLGEVAPGLPFTITVDAPRGQDRVDYEIFSESASDQIVRGEVAL